MKRTSYFRISLTRNCNQSCFFCHQEGVVGDGTELSIDDIVFACKIAKKMGFTKFKLTGGEPTLRADICSIVHELSKLNLLDFSMITNGSTLEHLAIPLIEAGLKRLNVTVNTLNEKRYSIINERHFVPLVNIIRGVDEAIRVGFSDMKINFVYMDESSDCDLAEMIDFVSQRKITLVVLPILPNDYMDNMPSWEIVRDKIANYGIEREISDIDGEGIKRVFLVMKCGAKVLIRQEKLSTYTPYKFCKMCTERHRCQEGIFSLRLSPYGVLIPCLVSPHKQIDISVAIKRRDMNETENAINQILSLTNAEDLL